MTMFCATSTDTAQRECRPGTGETAASFPAGVLLVVILKSLVTSQNDSSLSDERGGLLPSARHLVKRIQTAQCFSKTVTTLDDAEHHPLLHHDSLAWGSSSLRSSKQLPEVKRI